MTKVKTGMPAERERFAGRPAASAHSDAAGLDGLLPAGGVSNANFEYLRCYVWHRVMRWIRKKHRRINWEKLRRRYCTVSDQRWWPAEGDVILFDPAAVSTTRYRYRGTKIECDPSS